MNASMEDLTQGFEERPQQQKVHSNIKPLKSLKQGIRSVMNVNKIGKQQPVGGPFKEKLGKSMNKEPDGEMNLDDLLATIPRIVEDDKEDSLQLTDSASALHTSLHLQEQLSGAPPDSPRGPPESFGSLTNTSISSMPPARISNPGIQIDSPLSPVVGANNEAAQLKHPHSAPQSLVPGLSPGGSGKVSPLPSPHQAKNANRFLKGKIKISALKNFVGTGLDLAGSSNKHHQNLGITTDPAEDHARRGQEDLDADFASPQPAKGSKIANKMRKSIMGFANLAKTANRMNAPAILLEEEEDDLTESTKEGDKDLLDASDTGAILPTPQELKAQGFPTIQEKDEAKQRRREKHKNRRATQLQLDLESSHGGSGSIVTAHTAETTSSAQQRKKKGKLDAQARERLKKHSEGTRQRTATANRRRRQQLAHKRAELDSSDRDLPDLTPAPNGPPLARSKTAPVPATTKPETTMERTGHSSSRRLQSESQSGRKLNKEQDEKLRERVRSRQSFVAALGKKEESIHLIDLLNLKDKKDEADKKPQDEDEDDLSFADDIADSVEDSEEPEEASATDIAQDAANHEASLQDIFRGEHQADASAKAGLHASSGSDLNASSAHGGSKATLQGSFQHVESPRSDDYLQLIIGDVPPKASSPGSQSAEAPTSPKREKRPVKRGSRRAMNEQGMDSSEVRRRKTHRGEKRESSSRRRPRGEKGTSARHREGRLSHSDRSPPRRKSDDTGVRRRKGGAAPRSEAGNASDSVLSSTVGLENELPSAGNDVSQMESSVNAMEASSRSNLDGSFNTMNTSMSASATTYGGRESLSSSAKTFQTRESLGSSARESLSSSAKTYEARERMSSSAKRYEASRENLNSSAKTFEGGESGTALDASMLSNKDGNELPVACAPDVAAPDATGEELMAPDEPPADEESSRRQVKVDEMQDSSRRQEGKESRRRHHKGTREKRSDRRSSRPREGTSRHKEGTLSKSSKHRPTAREGRGGPDGGDKKDGSVRGRSVRPHRESKHHGERKVRRHSTEARVRRHSTDARKRPSASDADGKTPPNKLDQSTGNDSFSQIKW